MSPTTAPHLLLIEDDPDTAALIREALADHFEVDNLTHVDRVEAAMEQDLGSFDMVLCDMNLPDGVGLELVDRMLGRRRDLPVVMVTGEADLDSATAAIRRGAYDYIVKSGDYLFALPLIIEKNLAVWQIKLQNLRLHHELEQTLEALRIKNQQLEEAVNKLERQAMTDPLTALANRRHIQSMLDRGFAEAMRYGTDLACIMIDVDGFKLFNDSLGHVEGDRLLRTMARVLNANCRRCDVAGRYGGDEFVLLLPHTSPVVAEQVACRIKRQFVGDARAVFPESASCELSMGIACVSLSQPSSADQLVAMADAALYRAKQAGKARVFVHDKTPRAVRESHESPDRMVPANLGPAAGPGKGIAK